METVAIALGGIRCLLALAALVLSLYIPTTVPQYDLDFEYTPIAVEKLPLATD